MRGRVSPCCVTGIALRECRMDFGESDLDAIRLHLRETSFRSDIQTCFHEDLQGRIRKDVGAGIAPIRDQTCGPMQGDHGPHALIQGFTHREMVCDLGDCLIDARRAEASCERSTIADDHAIGVGAEIESKEQTLHGTPIAGVDARLKTSPSQGAVPSAGIQEGPSESFGESPGQGAFPGAGAAVDGDDDAILELAFLAHEAEKF